MNAYTDVEQWRADLEAARKRRETAAAAFHAAQHALESARGDLIDAERAESALVRRMLVRRMPR